MNDFSIRRFRIDKHQKTPIAIICLLNDGPVAQNAYYYGGPNLNKIIVIILFLKLFF